MSQMQKGMLAKGQVAALRAKGGDRREALVSAEALRLDSVDDYVVEIDTLWSRARDDYIRIGRYLNQARKQFGHGEYMKMCAERLPFGYQVAHQLRSIAEAVDEKRLDKEELPVTYSVAYQLVTLRDEVLKVARARKVVRPDVTRSEILAFKSEMRAPRTPKRAPSAERETAKLEEERERVREQMRGLELRLREIDDRLHELRGGGPTIDGEATEVAAD